MWWQINKINNFGLKIQPYCLSQIMVDSSSERKKDLASEDGVLVNQTSVDIGVNWPFTQPFQVTEEESKARMEIRQFIIIIIFK